MHISPNLSVSCATGECEGASSAFESVLLQPPNLSSKCEEESCASDAVLLQRDNNLLLRFAWWRATSLGPAAKIEGGAQWSVSRAEAARDEADGARCAQELSPQGQALLEKAAVMENDGTWQVSEPRGEPSCKAITL